MYPPATLTKRDDILLMDQCAATGIQFRRLECSQRGTPVRFLGLLQFLGTIHPPQID